jgi:glycosyltransferase involved in cell wall biosynthesis
VQLKIIDGRIPEDGLVPRTIHRLGLEKRVTIIDRMLDVSELVDQYSTARIALVPSFFEGFGFPASEAMACGLPVVANAVGALPEIVGSDGKAGCLIPPRNARAMATAISDILSEPGRAEQMGRNARQRIQRTFRWSEAAAGLATVFEETIRAAHRRSRAT